MVQLLRLPQTQAGRIDRTVLGRLENALGPKRSREVIEDACFEIIERLTRFEMAHTSMEAREARRLARAIAAISGEIGMPDLGDAARAAAESQTSGDPVARAATAQRLMRVGEGSLDALMGAPENSTA